MDDISEEILTAFLNEFRLFPDGLTAETLIQRAGVARADLPRIRKRLEQDGFSFETGAEGRWLLRDKPDILLPYWVRAGLRCDRLGQQVYYQPEVASTQDIAFEMMVEGRPHGTLVLTEHQTGGRGRSERVWYSNPGQSLLFSLLLDLEPPETFASVLTIAIATATARAIQDVAGVPAHIKFPNDLEVHGRKAAGILLEVRDYGVPRRAVAGVGVNVNQLEGDLHPGIRDFATSLRMERRDHEPVRRARLLRQMLRGLEKWLDLIAQGEYQDLEHAWNRFSSMEGREIRFLRGTEEVTGHVLGATIREGLLVRLASGEKRRFRLEHVSDVRFP